MASQREPNFQSSTTQLSKAYAITINLAAIPHINTMESKNPLVILAYTSIAALWLGAQLVVIPYVINLMCLVTSILVS